MLPNNLAELDILDLEFWIKEIAGSNNAFYFECKYTGGLELQQIPYEYARLLDFIRKFNAKSYLNIGIGNAGSFITEAYIQKKLKKIVAVDNTSYGNLTSIERINDRINWLKQNVKADVVFHNMNSTEYLIKSVDEKFDLIFIDGDHSYEGVKSDYLLSLPLLNENGVMIFHDINSFQCEGVIRFWNEVKNENCIEFVSGNKCGIGILPKNKLSS